MPRKVLIWPYVLRGLAATLLFRPVNLFSSSFTLRKCGEIPQAYDHEHMHRQPQNRMPPTGIKGMKIIYNITSHHS